MKLIPINNLCSQVKAVNWKDYPHDNFEYLDIASIDRENKRVIATTTTAKNEAPSRAKQPVISGDVLVSTVRPNLNAVALIEKVHEDSIASTGFCVLRPQRNKLDSYFLFYYTRSIGFIGHLVRLATGASYPAVSDKIIKSTSIPLPPLETQKRIVELLDRAQALIEKRREQIALMDQLVQSLFYDMFGDPVTNPMGWEYVPTIKYCSSIVPGRDKPKSFSGNIPWVTTDDLNHLGRTTLSKKNLGLTEFEIKQVKAKVIPKSSVIMTCVGDLGVVTINDCELVVNQQLHAFQCDEKILNPNFLMYNISCQTPYMYKMASSTTVPYMNKSVANNTPTIVPPLDLQNTFAKQVQKIESQKAAMTASLSELEDNFNSLMQRAFKGELKDG